MSIIGSNILAGASGQGGDYTIARSLRFRSSASAYLNRTPASTSSRTTWTWSGWVKLGALSIDRFLFNNSNDGLRIQIGNTLWTQLYDGATAYNLITTAVYRDPSAWYHVVWAVDTTQATASNRVKLYVNGSQVTAFSTATYPPQNYNTEINRNTATYIGSLATTAGYYFDGYMTEVNFIDGQALTPSSFGATNASTGVWQPKKYAGTYGTNGFYLPFTDNSALTSGSNAGLGKDFSGNGNYWNTNNISITAGSTYDSMTDVPTLTSATAANFCTWNPLSRGSVTSADGNLSATDSGTSTKILGTLGVSSGKWYWEVTPTSGSLFMIGVALSTSSVTSYPGQDASSWCWYSGNSGVKINNGSQVSYGGTYNTGDVIGVALDLDAGTLVFYKNNTSQGTAYSSLPAGTYLPTFGYNGTVVLNCGQRPFAYTPPTGFVALNTFNLPTPTIGATASTQANKNFDATLYTGNGSTQTITNAGGFSPDLVWAKVRNAAFSHQIYDTVRGATLRLASDSTSAEGTVSTGLTAFNSNGFSLGSDGAINGNGNTFVGWQWRGSDSSAVTNTAGSITSTVSANTSAGFSVVTYTGNGSAGATVGHGLGVAPKMIIVKSRSNVTNWAVYHSGLGDSAKYLWLNSTNAAATDTTYWNNTPPSSTVFTIGNNGNTNDTSAGRTFVAYCFSEVAGYSKFGIYTGNDSTDGPFIYCGFRPKFVILKASNGAYSWQTIDSARATYNPSGEYLSPNLSDAEGIASPNIADFLSNGFKLKRGGGSNATNGSSFSYIYMAFAESPFKYSLGR